MNIIFSTLLPLLSVGIGVFMLYFSWKSYSSSKNIKDWVITQGIITQSRVKIAGASFIPDIEFQYSVYGVEYKGNSVTIPPDIIYDTEFAQALLQEYPVGKQVDVFFNPEFHHVAVLEKEASTGTWWILIAGGGTGLFFLILGTAYLLLLLKGLS